MDDMIKGVRQFLPPFDWEAWSRDKVFVVTGTKPWEDFDTKAHLGTRIETIISKDLTPYEPGKNGETFTNQYRKLTFKVDKDLRVPCGAIVEPVDVSVTVYGKYSNMLSVKCKSLKILDAATTDKA